MPPLGRARGRMALGDVQGARACLGPAAVAKGLVVVGESWWAAWWAARRSDETGGLVDATSSPPPPRRPGRRTGEAAGHVEATPGASWR